MNPSITRATWYGQSVAKSSDIMMMELIDGALTTLVWDGGDYLGEAN